jgi:hypothetical protein
MPPRWLWNLALDQFKRRSGFGNLCHAHLGHKRSNLVHEGQPAR